MSKSKTVGMELKTVLKNERNILNQLKSCSQALNLDYFKIYLFHTNVPVDVIKIFLKKYSTILLDLNVQITKNYNSRVFYFVQEKILDKGNWRYCYTGDIIAGLEEYKNLITHIVNRENKKVNNG